MKSQLGHKFYEPIKSFNIRLTTCAENYRKINGIQTKIGIGHISFKFSDLGINIEGTKVEEKGVSEEILNSPLFIFSSEILKEYKVKHPRFIYLIFF